MLLDDSAEVTSSFRYNSYGDMFDFTGIISDGYHYTGVIDNNHAKNNSI